MNVSKAEQATRRAALLQALIAGHSYAQITQQLAVSEKTLSRDLKVINSQLAEWAAEQQSRALATAIAQYQRVIDQAWRDHADDRENERAWLAGEFAEAVQVPDAVDGARTEKRTQQQFRSQKSDYLRVIVAATEKLCKLAGLEAASKVDLRAAVAGRVEVTHRYEPERPERVLAILQEAGIVGLVAPATGGADDAAAP